MENEVIYYIHVNGQQVGPLRKEALLDAGLQPEIMVWRSDLPNWVKADTLPELVELMYGAPVAPEPPHPQPEPPQPTYRQPHQQPEYQNPSYGQPNPYAGVNYGQNPVNYPGQFPPGWYSWLTWAIIGTIVGGLFSCVGFITGIIAIVFSSQANSDAKSGLMASAESKNTTAKTLTIITLILGAIGLLACIGYAIFFGSLIGLASY